MDLLYWFIDIVLHLDKHLTELVADYSFWVYAILFLIVFCETGLVVTPFLPGDSLLFAIGALAAVDTTGTLNAVALWAMLIMAGVLGNEVNYRIGRAVGPRAFSGNIRWLKREYLERTQTFYEKYGGMTIVLSRFIPIIRTFAPFVAGIAKMRPRTFTAYNVGGGTAWVSILLWAGYGFGNVPIIKENFGLVTIGIIVVSVLPVVWAALRPQPARSG